MGTKVWTLGVALLVGLQSGTPAQVQGLVVPGSLAEVEGSTSIPFGLTNEVRLECN